MREQYLLSGFLAWTTSRLRPHLTASRWYRHSTRRHELDGDVPLTSAIALDLARTTAYEDVAASSWSTSSSRARYEHIGRETRLWNEEAFYYYVLHTRDGAIFRARAFNGGLIRSRRPDAGAEMLDMCAFVGAWKVHTHRPYLTNVASMEIPDEKSAASLAVNQTRLRRLLETMLDERESCRLTHPRSLLFHERTLYSQVDGRNTL